MSAVRCPHCSRPLRATWDTDARGDLVETLEFCGCPRSRRLAKICRVCDNPIDKPRSSYCCEEHRAIGAKQHAARYRKSEKYEEQQRRANKKRRTKPERARRREYERKRYNQPEVKERRLASARRRRMKNPAQKAEWARRYKEKYPERVAEQQRRANEKRAAAKREHMHKYCTKFVGRGIDPKCECGAVIPFDGVGRPMLRCRTCDPKRWRDRDRRQQKVAA